jgi:multidrug efflux pump subunit AcrB
VNISRWGIENPVPAALVFVILCVVGIWGWRQLPISTLPNFTPPEIIITVTLPGASASQLETDVTRKVEDAIAGVPDIDKLLSNVSEGLSRTRIQFELGRDLDSAIEEVRDAIDGIRPELPAEIDEPQISRVAILGPTLLTFTLESDRLALDELSWFVDDTVKKTLFGAAGVGTVARIGGLEREVRVDLRPDSLQSLGLTAGTVSSQLARIQVERAGGRTMLGGSEQTVRTVATVRSAAELANYPISLPDGRSVRLSAIAAVTDGSAEPRDQAFLDGRPVVGVTVQRAVGSSEVAVGLDVRRRMQELQAQHPEIRITEVSSSVEEAKNSYEASLVMLAEGALLAVIVVWFFLRDWRATWISALALPLSIIPTFGVMHLLGFSLNLLTLLAMAVVIGILVDDAIVEVENIARHRAMGKSPRQAAADAADEIGVAVVATSVTLAAVFIPVAFMPGQVGLFFREFGWTAAGAVLFSLLVARLLTPMLAAYFMTGVPRAHTEARWITRYIGWVEAALRHPVLTLSIALATFVASLALVPLIPATFVPAANESQATLQLELPPGAQLADTRAVAEEAGVLLREIPELESVFARAGSVQSGGYGGAAEADVRKAQLTLRFREKRKRTLQAIEIDIRRRLEKLPGVRVSFTAGQPGSKLELVLAGRDPEMLGLAAQRIEAEMRGVKGLSGVVSTASLLQPEIVIVPDPARAADLGVSTVDIATAARIATTGDFRQNLPKLNLPERQIPIRVQVAEGAKSDAALLALMRVPARNGTSVPLSAVADIRDGSGPAVIERYNRERNIKISGELNGNPLGPVLAQVYRLPSVTNLPAGVRVLPGGDAEAFGDLLLGFGLAMLAGVLSVYVVLLMLFNSATQPLVILGAVPLCGVGAFGALYLSGYALSLPSLVGLLMLTGVSTKNSILIVDYAILGQRDLGLPRREALLEACRKRVRPVIMTTLAMGAGMLPIALAITADGNFRAPLGVSVIGGLITSTFLSLVAVPAAYMLMASIIDWWNAKRGKPVDTAALAPAAGVLAPAAVPPREPGQRAA